MRHISWLLLLPFVLFGDPLIAQEQMVFGDPREIESELRIREALQTPVTLSFADATLEDAMAYLGQQIGQPIWLDKRALEDMGVEPDKTPVTFHCESVPAADALPLLLAALDLTWTSKDGLVITTPEAASTELVTRVYPVADLVTFPGEGAAQIYSDYDSLIQVITSVVSPTSWDEVGGPGSISPHESSCTLVLNQTREIHEQVERLLQSIRAARDWQGIPAPDIDLPWREYFARQTGYPYGWQQQNLAYAESPRSSITPAEVEAWQRPRLHE